MSATSNAVNAPGLPPQSTRPAMSALRLLSWSVRRELWENRSIVLAPLAAGALFLLGFAVSAGHLAESFRAAMALDPMRQRALLVEPYDFASGLLMLTTMIVGALYCVDALYGERRDRTALFWKSLPVSDATTVIAKALIPLFILPVVASAVAIATQFLMLLLHSAVLAANGLSASVLWSQLAFPRMSLLLAYHLMTVHALWPAPLFGWMFMVSAWARRAPLLWAFLPPIALCYLEKIALSTTHLASVLLDRVSGGGMEALPIKGTFPTNPMTHLTPLRFVTSPGLWIGLAIMAVFLVASARLRRSRGVI